MGVALLVGSILLRVSSNGKYEIKAIDLVFIVIPLLVFGLASGKLQGLDLFGVKADFSQLWQTAAKTQIESQISQLPVSPLEEIVEPIQPATKGGVQEIPRLIGEKTQALSFRLEMGGYYGPAIKAYFEQLIGSTYLRFIVVNNADNSLFGVYSAPEIVAFLRSLGERGYDEFANRVNEGDIVAKDWLSELPGFVPASAAVDVETSKRAALQVMEELDRPSLPVVDTGNRFVGTVERAKLTASLILAVTKEKPSE